MAFNIKIFITTKNKTAYLNNGLISIHIQIGKIVKLFDYLLVPIAFLIVRTGYIFNVIAFTATTTVDNDIMIAPTAGLRTNPTPAKTPAARGIAKIL